MIRSMDEAPRDGSHFLALERVGIVGTNEDVLEWREIWYEPTTSFIGPTMWKSEAGGSVFGAKCFAGWIPLPPKHGAR